MTEIDVPYTGPGRAFSNKVKIIYDAFGKPGHPAVLLIMGLGDQMITWHEDFCRSLARKGYFVIRFDNRDIGLSGKFHNWGKPDILKVLCQRLLGQRPSIAYNLSDMAADAASVLDALDIESAHVAGVSMGGMIGQMMAIEHSGRVNSLVSMISAPDALPPLYMLAPFCLGLLRSCFKTRAAGGPPPSPSIQALELLVKKVPMNRVGFSAYYAQVEKALIGPGFTPDSRAAMEFAKGLFDRGLNPHGMARQLAAIIGSPSRIKQLKGLRTPTLVMHGDSDPLIPLLMGKRTSKLIPGARLKIYKGMGHWLPVALWPDFIDTMADFFARAKHESSSQTGP